jgi:hypothetical protein
LNLAAGDKIVDIKDLTAVSHKESNVKIGTSE